MRNYELALIASPELTEEQLNDNTQEFISWLQDQGGIFINQDMQGRRVLPSLIKEKNQGFLVSLHFALDPEKIQEVTKKVKETPYILRSMLVITPAQKTTAPTSMGVTASQESVTQENLQEQAQKQADVEDIDKKLEEIFKGELL